MNSKQINFTTLICAIMTLFFVALPMSGYSAGNAPNSESMTNESIATPIDSPTPEGLSGQNAQKSAIKVKGAARAIVEEGVRPPRDSRGEPDAAGYWWLDSNEEDGPAYAWIDIRGIEGAQQLQASDDWNSGVIQLGFETTWYGVTYDAIRVCSNGWITFDVNYGGSDYPLPQCSDASGVNNILAVMGYDIDPGAGGEMWFWTNNQDQAVIEWFQVPDYDGPMVQTMEIVINANGRMIYQYEDFQNFDVNRVNVGYENQDGQMGANIAFHQNGIGAGMAIAIQFEQPDQNPHRFDVPGEYGTIQAAIDATTADGDTVLVQQGTYYENLVVNEGHMVNVFSNYALSGDANDIWNTILDGNNAQIMNVTGSDSPVHLKGLVIQNGVGNFGGAIVTNSDLSLTICVFRDNHANVSGGAISAYGDVPKTITSANCTYANNNAQDYGGVFFLNNVNLDSDHDLIFGNTAGVGGVLGQHNPPINISFNFCTVVDNSDNTGVGGMWNFGMYGDNGNNYPNHITITNSIFRNAGYEAANLRAVADHENIYDITYSDFDTDGGDHGILVNAAIDLNWGTGSFSADPLLDGNHIVTGNSPCVDAADPNADDDADGTRADMGYYYYNHEQGPRTRYVPSVYATIQAAIDAASAGDNIQVAAGTYNENINFHGQNVTVTGDADNPANVIIDGGGNGAVVTFENEESNQAILAGFTITNGSGGLGGGIVCSGASTPLIQHCTITGNSAGFDGGISVYDGSVPTFEFCTVSNNYAEVNDGGFGVHGGGATFNDCSIISNSSGSQTGGINVEGNATLNMTRCVIADNTAPVIGGGFLLWGGHVSLTNCVVYGNSAGNDAGAIHLIAGSSATLVNSIVWDNSPNGIVFRAEGFAPSSATISYSDIEGGVNGVVTNNNGQLNWGAGNINLHPRFVDAGAGDFSLQFNSPCINAGDPEFGNDPDGSHVEMGAFYFENPPVVPWTVTIVGSVNGVFDSDNTIGTDENATNDFDDAFDVVEPPSAPDNFISVYFPHPEWNHFLSDNFTSDIRAIDSYSEDGVYWDMYVSTDIADEEVTLTFSPNNLPDFNLGVLDVETGEFQNLLDDSTFVYNSGEGGVKHFRIAAGDRSAPTVESPSFGEETEIEAGSDFDVTWIFGDAISFSGGTIYFSADEGATWTIVGTLSYGQTTFTWGTGAIVTSGGLFRVVGSDFFGNAFVWTSGTFRLVDTTSPTLVLTYPNAFVNVTGGLINVTWQAGDLFLINRVVVHYSVSGGAWTLIDSVDVNEGQIEWTTGAVYFPSVRVRVTVYDVNGNFSVDVSDEPFAITPLELEAEHSAGWNLMSTPLEPNDPDFDAAIGDDIEGRFYAFNYDPAFGYRQASDLVLNRGYWLGLNGDATLNIQGTASITPEEIPLASGWNLIGTSFPISVPLSSLEFSREGDPVTLVDAVDSGWVQPVLFGYSNGEGSYTSDESMQPWSGYWFKALTTDVTMIATPNADSPEGMPHRRLAPEASNWEFTITVNGTGSADNITSLGVDENASADFDAWFDQPEPPNPPGRNYISAYFDHHDWDNNLFGYRFNSDFHSPIEEGGSDEWNLDVASGDTGTVTLSWDGLARSLPEGFEVRLIDDANQREINLREAESYQYFSDGSHQFNVIVTAPNAGPAPRELRIPLRNGWNMISLNVEPGEEFYRQGEDRGPDVRLILDQLRDNQGNSLVSIIKDEDGRFYVPRSNFNNIPFWNLSQGYQVKLFGSTELVHTGIQIPADRPIEIENGWNLIAYYPDYELSAARPNFVVVSSILESVLIAKDQDGRFMVPRNNYSNMSPWREGRGYQIKVSNNVELTYPTEGGQIGAVNEDPISQGHAHWIAPASTGRNMSVLLSEFNGISVKAGDEVAAFDAEGNLVGRSVIDGDRNCGLTVWGDDPEVEGKLGLADGESYSLQLWQAEGGVELSLTPRLILEGSGLVYATDDFSHVATKAAPQIPVSFYLEGVYPNPFNTTTSISYGLPERTNVRLTVTNIAGQTVAVLQSGEQEAGKYNLRWNADALSSGIYFLRLEAGNYRSFKKVNLLK